MKAEELYNKFLPFGKHLLQELDHYGEKQFKRRIEESDWSIGEWYDFMLNGTYQFHLKNIKNCLEYKFGRAVGKKRFAGNLTFALGKYPPYKIKTYSTYVPVQPEDIPKTRDLFFKFLKDMHKIAKDIDAKGKQDYKTMHPSLGMLDALEWYQLIDIHFRHYAKKKLLIDQVIRSFQPLQEGDPD